MTEEHRDTYRDTLLGAGITAFAETPDGRVLEGVVRDVSDGGARISGPTDGLHIGDEIRIVLVIDSDQKVAHICEVRHIEVEECTFGIEFKSKPQLLDGPNPTTKFCHLCSQRYTAEWVFCGQCGTELKCDHSSLGVASVPFSNLRDVS